MCYVDVEAKEYKFCDEFDGWQSCYSTYDKCKKYKISIGNLNLIFKMERLLEEDAQKGTEYV